MFTDKEIVLQYKEDDSVQIQNQEEEEDDDDDDEEVMPELIQVLEKSEEENDKK